MGQTKIEIFIILTGIVLLIFITGIFLFLQQYRKKRLEHEKEKAQINKQHQIELLNTQVESQAQTMQFIGQEIHDSVAQKLTLASIYLQRIGFENKETHISEEITSITKIMSDSLAEMRQLSKNLTENTLQQASLVDLIKMECDQVNAAGICCAVLNPVDNPVVSVTVKNSLLRIAQEFIQNSIKHSGCANIFATVCNTGTALEIILEDDGKGFEIEEVQHKGIGMDNIRRRVQTIGGSFILESEIEKGTKLHITVPL